MWPTLAAGRVEDGRGRPVEAILEAWGGGPCWPRAGGVEGVPWLELDLFGRVTFCVFELLAGFCDGNFEYAPWPELKIKPTPSLPLPAEFGENFTVEEGLV